MVKKKKVGKTKRASRTITKASRRTTSSVSSVEKKIGLAWKNLIFFAVLFGISLAIYYYLNEGLLANFFGILSLIMGFASITLLIVYLILVFTKSFKK